MTRLYKQVNFLSFEAIKDFFFSPKKYSDVNVTVRSFVLSLLYCSLSCGL